MNLDDATIKIEFRWSHPIIGLIADVVKWPLQILYFCGHPGRSLLFWLNDWFLTVGKAEYRWPGKEWEPVIGNTWIYTNEPAGNRELKSDE